ncbi:MULTISPECIES: alpha/beta fold hydrolase [unclassified Acidovorax]|uniref:alpha/beta fold hydrolase n=1 Tax=unclassified Acidovorax TaxID=2684926 RepID=UPI0038574775
MSAAPSTTSTSSQPATPVDMRDAWITTPAGRLFARRWTAAAGETTAALPPIVLFHDSLGCIDLWRDFPAVLCRATGRDVIAYDRLGFGRSDARAGQPPLDFVAEEARDNLPALRAQLGVQRFVALGHSVGGGMAAHCAAADHNGKDSSDCEALITIAAQACVEERTLQGIRAAQSQFDSNPEQITRLARYHGGSAERARWVLNAWVDTWLAPAFADWSLEAAMRRVTCPVLALHGELDEYGSAEQPARIARWAAGPARVQMLPGLAHVPHREQPEAVAALVAQFLVDDAGTSGVAATQK